MVTQVAPGGQERAKDLLGQRALRTGLGLGLDPVPQVLLHPSVIERFAAHAPGLTGVTRRTLRTSLRFLARALVPALAPADRPLPRERAKAPYTPAQIDGYLALAAAQPMAARWMRASGLVCLGVGAGRIRADLRAVRGTDITCRSGGVIVAVHGRRPRAVPVLARYHRPLLAAARFAGTSLVTGGTTRSPERDHPADPRAGRRGRAAPAGHLPAAGDLAAGLRHPIGLAAFLHAAGITAASGSVTCSHRSAPAPSRRRRPCWGGQRRNPAGVLEAIIEASGVAPRIEALLPAGRPPPPANIQHPNWPRCLTRPIAAPRTSPACTPR